MTATPSGPVPKRPSRAERLKARIVDKVARLDPDLFARKRDEWTRGGFPAATLQFIYKAVRPPAKWPAGLPTGLAYEVEAEPAGHRFEHGKHKSPLTNHTDDDADSKMSARYGRAVPVFDRPLPVPDWYDRKLDALNRQHDDAYDELEKLLDRILMIEKQSAPAAPNKSSPENRFGLPPPHHRQRTPPPATTA